jgi:hypothetical protein
MIITAARTVDRGVVDVDGNETWQSIKFYVVPLVRYMGKGREGMEQV